MNVRVFVPAEGSNEQYDGSDFHFETMPLRGHFLRLFTPEPGDYPSNVSASFTRIATSLLPSGLRHLQSRHGSANRKKPKRQRAAGTRS